MQAEPRNEDPNTPAIRPVKSPPYNPFGDGLSNSPAPKAKADQYSKMESYVPSIDVFKNLEVVKRLDEENRAAIIELYKILQNMCHTGIFFEDQEIDIKIALYCALIAYGVSSYSDSKRWAENPNPLQRELKKIVNCSWVDSRLAPLLPAISHFHGAWLTPKTKHDGPMKSKIDPELHIMKTIFDNSHSQPFSIGLRLQIQKLFGDWQGNFTLSVKSTFENIKFKINQGQELGIYGLTIDDLDLDGERQDVTIRILALGPIDLIESGKLVSRFISFQ